VVSQKKNMQIVRPISKHEPECQTGAAFKEFAAEFSDAYSSVNVRFAEILA